MNTAQQIQAGFDISNLEVATEEPTFKVAVIEDDDGEPVSGFVIVGKNSPQFQQASNAIRISNIKRASKRNKQIDSSTDEGAAAIARTVEKNDRTIALAVVTDWFGFNLEGAPMNFDRNLAEKMFIRYPQWQAKVVQALENDSNFMKV